MVDCLGCGKLIILRKLFNVEYRFCEASVRYWTLEISDDSDEGDRIRYWRVLSQSVPGRTRWEIWLDLRYWEIGGRTTGDICNSENKFHCCDSDHEPQWFQIDIHSMMLSRKAAFSGLQKAHKSEGLGSKPQKLSTQKVHFLQIFKLQ